MATVLNSAYGCDSGKNIFAGLARVDWQLPDMTGGAVHQLLSAVPAGAGFVHLSTVPAAPTYTHQPHAGAVWSEERQVMWTFGAETHSTEAGYINTPFYFDVETGLVSRMYASTPSAGYILSDDGLLWSSAAKLRPWAMHTYSRMIYDEAEREIIVGYDAQQHAYLPAAVSDPNITNRRSPFWIYNTITGKWRTNDAGSTTTFLKNRLANGLCRVPGYGWFGSDSTYLLKLDESFNYSAVNLGGKINSNYHDKLHFSNGNLYKWGGHDTTYLYSKTPIDNQTSTTRILLSSISQLSGWDITNKPSLVMPDGNILFLAHRAISGGYEVGAFVFNVATSAIVDTGHRLTGMTAIGYDFRFCWSQKYNAAIFWPSSIGLVNKIYGLKL